MASDFYWNGQDIRDRTFELACAVVVLADVMYDHGRAARTMAPQVVNSSTSVAAMLEEARGAESLKDFISKLCIALKEARETVVRLRICHRTQKAMAPQCEPLVNEANEVAAIIGSIVRNNRTRLRQQRVAKREGS